MKFDIITIFPDFFDSFKKESIIARALKNELIEIKINDLRKWSKDKHKTVDDKPYGGGRGMVMKVEPIYQAVKDLKKKTRTRKRKVILFSPRGKRFNQKTAFSLSKLKHLILICGRYEGIDERVARHIADQTISIGDYVLMGGEIPAMILIETITRLIPGVLGKSELLKERITKKRGFIEYPQYTRPEVFSPKKEVKWRVPKVLISGNHKEIEKWREKRAKSIGN